jgi:hypothetical protein
MFSAGVAAHAQRLLPEKESPVHSSYPSLHSIAGGCPVTLTGNEGDEEPLRHRHGLRRLHTSVVDDARILHSIYFFCCQADRKRHNRAQTGQELA